MNSAIHIGNNFDKTSMDNVAGAIERIFKSGHDNRMDQATVQLALSTLGRLGQVEGARVESCTFMQNPPEHVGPSGVHIVRVPLDDEDPRQPGDKDSPESEEDRT